MFVFLANYRTEEKKEFLSRCYKSYEYIRVHGSSVRMSRKTFAMTHDRCESEKTRKQTHRKEKLR
jgi:hypothetical protein